jgi:hypothetical protein
VKKRKKKTDNKIDVCMEEIMRAIDKKQLHEIFGRFSEELCNGAVRGGDFETFRSASEWVSWLSWSSVMLDERDYLTAAVYALRVAPRLAATDYGRSRQRDLGQLWTDAIRGYLGEAAFVKWLSQRFQKAAKTSIEAIGPRGKFLSTDIIEVDGRSPKIKISIKATKLNGIWLDIPYKQIEHSDVFVLVRVGVAREHFVAFLKAISVIRDKLLEPALGSGIITQDVYGELWQSLPNFTPVPAYVAGYFDKREYSGRIDAEKILEVDGVVEEKKEEKKLVINKYLGYWNPKKEDLRKLRNEKLSQKIGRDVAGLNIEFEGVKEFSRTDHFIVSSGLLKRTENDWTGLVAQL